MLKKYSKLLSVLLIMAFVIVGCSPSEPAKDETPIVEYFNRIIPSGFKYSDG